VKRRRQFDSRCKRRQQRASRPPQNTLVIVGASLSLIVGAPLSLLLPRRFH
jgi:hypothetical protein